MDADWWKNDAAKVNKMESAMVKHKVEFNYGGKKLQWKSAMEIIQGGETVFEVANQNEICNGKSMEMGKHSIKVNSMKILDANTVSQS